MKAYIIDFYNKDVICKMEDGVIINIPKKYISDKLKGDTVILPDIKKTAYVNPKSLDPIIELNKIILETCVNLNRL